MPNLSQHPLKAIAQQARPAERAELGAAMASEPARQAEFARWQAQAGVAREVLPLVSATEATAGELPACARPRLQTKVRETLGRPVVAERSKGWGWRLFLVLTPAAAVVFGLLSVLLLKPAEPMIQVAMLDTAGGTRGAVTNEIVLLQQQWPGAAFQPFEKADELAAWAEAWPRSQAPVAKVIFDPATAEVRLLMRVGEKRVEKKFSTDGGLPAALQSAGTFIQEQARH